MKIVIPSNIFSALFAFTLTEDKKAGVVSKPASMISSELEKGNADIALIPSFDLLKHKDFFISKTNAISFDGFLSNSYLYFKPNQNDFSKLHLRGDVSSNEAVLSKILFAEKYSSEIEVNLDAGEIDFDEQNYLVCGAENFEKNFFSKGLSFSDDIADLINYPYTNYLLASKDQSTLATFAAELKGIDKKVEDSIKSFLEIMNLSSTAKNQIAENINSVYFELTDNELDGLNELFRLPYFHGIIKEIIEIKFV